MSSGRLLALACDGAGRKYLVHDRGNAGNVPSLGYEQCDARLCRLVVTLVTALASANSRQHVPRGPVRLPRLTLVPLVLFTTSFTDPGCRPALILGVGRSSGQPGSASRRKPAPAREMISAPAPADQDKPGGTTLPSAARQPTKACYADTPSAELATELPAWPRWSLLLWEPVLRAERVTAAAAPPRDVSSACTPWSAGRRWPLLIRRRPARTQTPSWRGNE
jgi:hypothetical protein